MKNIYLIRHGRQASKLCNVDVSLCEEGKKQSILLGERLSSYNIERLYSSHLLRAKETAQILNHSLKVTHDIIHDLQEISFGALTGMTNEEIRKNYGDFMIERLKCKKDIPYPSGENGENVVNRVLPHLSKIVHNKEDNIAIVTHGGTIRCIVSYVLQMNLKDKLRFAIDMENTSITQLVYDNSRGEFFLERFNDYAHLEEYPQLRRNGWKKAF